MRELVRRNLRFFVIVSLAALGLRLVFLLRFPAVVTDSFIYGDIAKNWLQHGIYGLSGSGEISPTYIRLPGYPAFLALIFSIFGIDNYRAVLVVQMFVDLGTCFLCADIAWRLLGVNASKIAFWLAALCPFLINYSAAALTETLEVFFTVLALNLAINALATQRNGSWAACGAACGGATLLRPDGALLVIAIEIYIIAVFIRDRHATARGLRLWSAILLLAVAILPLCPWALRNWRVFHRFQPLAPRYANEENEFVPMGFNRWTKSWIADYVSVEEIYWAVPGGKIDPATLPLRAFDTPQQRQETQRVLLDMWLRPRTEMLPCDSRWWEFNDEPKWSALAVGFGAINLAYLLCAIAGWMRFRSAPTMGLLVLFIILRSAFLGTLENPEPRYTLETYPIIIVLAAAAFVPRRKLL